MALRSTAQILIIDDDREASRVITSALKQDGHQAHLALDADTALTFARDHCPEIVILDRHALQGRGLDLVPALFEASPASPIVIAIEDPSIGAEIEARDHGAFDVLHKPFRDLTLLSQRLNVAIQTSRALRERDQVITELRKNTHAVQALQGQVQELSEKLLGMNKMKPSDLDELTGLLTENAFMDQLQSESARALRYARPITVGLAQIDGIGAIATRLGDSVADEALQEVAGLVRAQLRDIDIAGCFDSKEIGYILPETDKASGQIAAERIRARIENTMLSFTEHALNLSITIGYASLPTDAMNANGLLACARGARTAASSVGVNQILGFRA